MGLADGVEFGEGPRGLVIPGPEPSLPDGADDVASGVIGRCVLLGRPRGGLDPDLLDAGRDVEVADADPEGIGQIEIGHRSDLDEEMPVERQLEVDPSLGIAVGAVG